MNSHKLVDKLWGSEEWIVNSPLYCGKILTLRPGFQSSLHYHPVKTETFYVDRGRVLLELGDDTFRLQEGNSITILPTIPHRFHTTSTYARVFEFSTEHSDTDVVRIEESRRI